MDDTQGNKRLWIEHPNGTMVEWNEKGEVRAIRGTSQSLVLGNVLEKVGGNLSQVVAGAYAKTVGGKVEERYLDDVQIMAKKHVFKNPVSLGLDKGIARKDDGVSVKSTFVEDAQFWAWVTAVHTVLTTASVATIDALVVAYNAAIITMGGVPNDLTSKGTIKQGSDTFKINSGTDGVV